MSNTAEITLDGKTFSFPVITGTEGEKAIDITKLRDETGYITLDTGYKNTGATKSAITFLDGELGVLKYRGYPIEQLAEKSTFIEVAFLLIYGELPTIKQLDAFSYEMSRHTLIHEDMKKFFDGYPSKAHPMGQLVSLVCSLSSFYPESLEPNPSKADIDLTIIKLLAKMSTIVSWIHKKSLGHPLIYPQNKLDFISNFLNMTLGYRTEEYIIDPVVVDAMNKLLTDKKYYQRLRTNALACRKKYCWQEEEKKLIAFYKKFIGKEELRASAAKYAKSEYGKYLLRLVEEEGLLK